MMTSKHSSVINKTSLFVLILTLVFLLSSSTLLAHGGKKHGDEEFSNFQAVQKATELYNKLIISQKLPEVWETGLTSISVNKRQTSGKMEYVVQFSIAEGNPTSVFFFFDWKGKYSGSNFTGN